jgi:PHD/YefM family antitoxin component YafN of YafNO toxin-antitoxin module
MELQPEVINNATLFLFDIGRWAASELKERWKVSRQKSGKTTGQVDITNQDDQAKQQMVVLLNDLTKELGASKLEPVFNLIKQKSDMIVEWREMKIDHEKEYNRQMITRAALRLRQQELNKKILQTMAEIEAELSKIDVKVKKEDINLGS